MRRHGTALGGGVGGCPGRGACGAQLPTCAGAGALTAGQRSVAADRKRSYRAGKKVRGKKTESQRSLISARWRLSLSNALGVNKFRYVATRHMPFDIYEDGVLQVCIEGPCESQQTRQRFDPENFHIGEQIGINYRKDFRETYKQRFTNLINGQLRDRDNRQKCTGLVEGCQFYFFFGAVSYKSLMMFAVACNVFNSNRYFGELAKDGCSANAVESPTAVVRDHCGLRVELCGCRANGCRSLLECSEQTGRVASLHQTHGRRLARVCAKPACGRHPPWLCLAGRLQVCAAL